MGTRRIGISPAVPIFKSAPALLRTFLVEGQIIGYGAPVRERPTPNSAPRCCSLEGITVHSVCCSKEEENCS